MSLVTRQHTCACCGRDISAVDRITIEPLVDSSIRYVATHWECSTFPRHTVPTQLDTEDRGSAHSRTGHVCPE